MNFADLEQAWHTPENRPSPAAIERQREKLHARLRRRRRGFVLFLIFVFAALVLTTGGMLRQLIAPDPAGDRIDLAREWVVVPMIALPWIAALVFLRQFQRRHRAAESRERPIVENVRSLLEENRLSRVRSKTVAILQGVFLPLVPLAAHQLRAVGKAGDEILLPAFVIWPVIVAGIVLAVFLHYRRKLLPEKQQLEKLLEAYE